MLCAIVGNINKRGQRGSAYAQIVLTSSRNLISWGTKLYRMYLLKTFLSLIQNLANFQFLQSFLKLILLDEWNNFSAVLPYATIPLKVPIEPRTLISNSDWFSKISFDPPVEGVFQEFQLRGNTFANLSFKRK